MIPIDHSIPLKGGEQFDLAALNQYLAEAAPTIGTIQNVTRFPGGYSNVTYCLETANKEYVLRMPPAGAQIHAAHDMGREFRVISLLEPHYKKAPHVIHCCEATQILGAPFYMMERIKGVILRAGNAPKMQIEKDQMHAISMALIDNLVDLHSIDIEKTGLIQLGKPAGYLNRQVSGWVKRYFDAETDTIENMNMIADWLSKQTPRAQTATLLHNDYKYDNVILDPNKLSNIICVLDWEMTTVGDPLMDLGASLAYWFEAGEEEVLKIYNLTWLTGNLTRKEVVDHYAEKTHRDVSDILFYYVFGLFKNAVIGQQIYQRFKQGKTNDARFGALLPLIQLLSLKAIQALDKNRL
ncbi:MAG: phosphotransferase family protein [Bacteroidetes bacterium]|nr:phosphotransferase family protein [Bacteroidota bacterium]